MNVSVAPAVSLSLVVFLLEDRRYAVDLAGVERVVRMVALTPFPAAPQIVQGVFDCHGMLVPVMNVRRRFGLPERPPRPSDQLLLLRTRRRLIAFAVDAVEPAVAVQPGELVAAETVVPGLEHVRGIVRLPGDGMVFVHDVDTFLSLEETKRLDAAFTEVRT